MDWKRSKHLLTSDPDEQFEQSYGKTGLLTCTAAPTVQGPCSEMPDCAYIHYLAQLHLYALFLEVKYDVIVLTMALVQCHPEVGATVEDYNEAGIVKRLGFAAQLLGAFAAGWQALL